MPERMNLPDDVDAWFETLPDRVAEACRGQLRALASGHDPGSVVALGMWSDADAGTFVCGVCTKDDVDAARRAMPSLSPADVVWEFDEWTRSSYDLDDTTTRPLDDVAAEIVRVRRAVRDGALHHDDPAVLKYMTWQVGAIALAVLFEDGFFDSWPVAVQVFGVSDEHLDAQTRIEWIEMCNTDEATAAFAEHVRRG